MANAKIGKDNVPIGEIVRDNLTLIVELHATGIRWFKLRAWIGSRIMRLAACVIGCSIEINGPI